MNIKNKIKIMLSASVGLVFFGLAFLTNFVSAQAQTKVNQTNAQIPISAYVLNRDKTALANGDYDVRFAIYTTDRQNFDPYPSNSDKASQVWSETQKISITNGLISTYLGSTTPLPVSLTFSNGDYYLGVMIGNDGEMAPRKKIGSVPAAINSVYLQGKTIGNQAGDIPMLGAGGQIDVAMLPTGTGTGQLITGSDSRLHNQNTDTGTDQTIFNVGSGTSVGSTNFDLAVSNDSAKPTLRFDATERVWKLSNNGSVFDQVLTTASQFSTDKLVSGILPVGRGGLGLASFNPGDLLFASAQNALAALPIGTEGYCLKVRDNVPYWELCTTGSQHNLLSSMHPDTEASSVQRGDLIVGQGSTPLWRRLPIGDTGKVLRSDGIDVNWQTLTKADLGLSNVENVALSTWGSLGTITTGVWQGSNISTHYGGTGLDGSGAGFGALLIGNGSGYTLATLTPGLGISIANTSGAISIASTLGTSVDLASEVEGILPVVNGGTGTSTLTTNGVLFGNGTSAVAASAAGTSGQLLLANASGLPFFATLGGDATLAATGAITIGTGAIDSLKIADNTIKENNLSVTNDPTAGYILTYDSLGRFTWISNTGGSGASKWTDTGAYTYLSKTTNGLALGSSSAIDAPLFFDPTSNSIIFQGATIDEYRTTLTLVDPTANRTLTLPNVSGELSALGQTIETGEITNGTILGADLNFTGVTGAPRDGEVIVYDNATGGFGSVAIGSGGIGDITSIGDVISNDAFTATSTQGSSLWFYDSHGRGQLTLAPLSNPRTYTLPDASGTIITTGNFPDITQLATITNGTWHGAAIGAAYGGTGLNTSALTGVATVALGAWNITSTLAANLGGTGLDTHSATGVPTLSTGTWSVAPTLPVRLGGTGVDGTAAGFGALLIGNGSGYTLGTLMAGQGIAINNDSAMITISSTLGTTVDLTSAVVGLLPIASGGTGAGVFTPHGVLLGNGTSAITATAPISAGQLLVSNGTLTPAFVSLSGDASITAAGVFSIGASAITGNKIASATIKSGNLAATNGPSAGYILSYDPISTGFVWISNTGGAGASKWTDAGSYTYLNSITSDMALGGNSTTDSAFFFDVSTGDITLQGATIDQNKTTLHTTDPTANRAITFPDASGEVSLLGQSIDSSEITNGTILPVDLSTSNAGAEGQVLIYNSASSNFAWSSAGSGGIGDITSVGNALTGDAFSATGTAGTSLWFYDPQGRGQLTINDLTAARTYFLPDASGTVITSGNLSDIVRTGTIANGTWNGAVIDPIYGGTGSPTRFTKGSVVFAGNSGAYNQSNTNFFWDDANSRLGLGTIVPAGRLDVRGAGTGTGIAFQTQSATGTLGIVALDNGNIGLGTTSAAQQLSLTGSLAMVDTTTATTGVIYKGVNRFIHNFAASGTSGSNFFAGTSAGNFTMSGTGTQASFNTGLGVTTLSALTNGAYNSAVGAGASAGNTTGNYNSTFGSNALFANTIGSNNVAFGYQAGQFQADGVTAMTDPENSIYLGAGSKGATNSDPNSIVIGYGAVGLGANTTVIGNASTTLTKLFGNLNLTASSYLNWGATAGAGGYGMRDNGGIIEYRNSTGAWTSISAGAGGMAIGGNIASVTAGSVLYANASGNMAQDNSNFFYDGTNSRLGLGNTSPQYLLDVSKSTNDYLARIYNLNPGSSAGGLSIRTDGTGNLLNLNANGSDIVTISEAASTFNNPTSFMAVGDVSMAYDLILTNSTLAAIHSAGPVAISAGETFGSSYLTLQTFNAGKIVLDAAGGVALNQAQAWMLAAGTSALNLTNSAGTTLLNVDSTNGRIGIGNATPGGTLSIVSANTAGTTTGAALNLSANSLTTGTGFYGASSTLTTGDLMDLQVSGTAAGASQTALNILTTGANATAAISTYGAQISNTHTGAGTNVGMYLNASGGTNNYGLIVAAGNVGIGTGSPLVALDVRNVNAVTSSRGNLYISTTDTQAANIGGQLSFGGIYTGTSDTIFGTISGRKLNSIDTDYSGYLQFGTRNYGSGVLERMRIDNFGNVGIGTTAPAGLLQVTQPTTGPGTVSNTAGGTTLTGVGTQFTNTFKVGDTVTVGGQTVAISAIGSDTSMTVAAITNANTSVAYTLTGGSRLAVLGNGNVGIGTMAPKSKIESYYSSGAIQSSPTIGIRSKMQFSATIEGYTGDTPQIGFGLFGAYGSGLYTSSAIGQVQTSANGYTKGDLIFATRDVTTDTQPLERVRITSNGNVGIGTTTPYGKLNVYGAPTASANYGTLSIGGGAFDGSSAGYFVGSVNGTSLAVDEATGYGGNLLDLQVAGSSKFNVSYQGTAFVNGTLDAASSVSTSDLSSRSGSNTLFIQSKTMGGGVSDVTFGTGTHSQSSGSAAIVKIAPTYTQSGTTGATDLLINRTQTAIGSGAQLLIDAQVGGASKFNVTNTGQGYFAGNVGIGTTSPATKLEVNGSVRFLGTANATPVDGELFYDSNNHYYKYYNSNTSTWQSLAGGSISVSGGLWNLNGSNISYSDGNVGIGTTSPSHKLDVAGNIGLATSSYVNWGATDGTGGYGLRDNAGSIEYKNSTGAWAAVGGILGVGNSITSATAGSVFFAGTAGVLAQDNTNFNYDSTGHTFKLGYDSTHYGTLSVSSAGVLTTTGTAGQTVVGGTGVADLLTLKGTSNAGATATSPAIQMNVGNNGATNAMTILNNGNVGIGTTGPGAKLDVSSSSGGSGSGIRLIQAAENGTASISYVPIDFTVPTTGLIGQFLANANNYSNAGVNSPANSIGLWAEAYNGSLTLGASGGGSGDIRFNTNGYAVANERMRISSGGNVGIGTTNPSTYTLQVVGTGGFGTSTNSPIFQGQAAAVTFGNATYASTIAGSALTISPTAWTATPTISGLITATSGITSNGTFTLGANQAFTMNSGTGAFTQTYTGASDGMTLASSSTTDTKSTLKISQTGATTGTDYGLYATNTGVGTTNVGGYFSASGATNNYGLIVASGNVGIGTTTPGSKLEVFGDTLLTNSGLLKFGGTTASSVALKGSGTSVQVKLADDSAFAPMTALSFQATSSSAGLYLANGSVIKGAGSVSGYKSLIGLNTSNLVSIDADAAGTIFGGSVGIGTTTPYGKLNVYGAPTASANFGTLSIGGGAFDGTTTGKFVGNANGTSIAVDEASAYTGNLMDLQVGGSSKFKVDYTGSVNTPGYISASSLITSSSWIRSQLWNPGTNGAILWEPSSAITNTGNQVGLRLAPTYNQTSGTASNTDLLINRTETSLGSGAQLLIDAQVGGASKFSVSNLGNVIAGNYNGNAITTGTGTLTLSSYTLALTGSSSINQNLLTTSAPTFAGLTLNGTLTQSGSTAGYLASLTNTDVTTGGGLFVQTNGTGNLLNLNANGSDIVTVSEANSTFNNPISFMAVGDISMAYDLLMINQTASAIRSNAPLTIEAGEIFESNDLTLRTFNAGQVVLDSPGGVSLLQSQAWVLATGTSALNFTNPAGTSLLNIDSTNGRVGIGTTGPGAKLQVFGAVSSTGPSTTDKGSFLITTASDSGFALSFGGYQAPPYGQWIQAMDGRSGQAGTFPLLLNPLGGSVGIGTTSPYGKLTVYGAPTASANFGTLSIGGGAFDGTTAGKFVGNASGTSIAVNEASGYGGNLLDLQVAGANRVTVDKDGKITTIQPGGSNQSYLNYGGLSVYQWIQWGGTNTQISSVATGTHGATNYTFKTGGDNAFVISGVANIANYLTIASAVTGGAVNLQATGTDTNINLALSPKGTGSVGIGTTTPYGKLTVYGAPTASANYGTLSIGGGTFDGTTAGYFSGNAAGTSIAVNEASGYTGNLIDLQMAGSRKFSVDFVGNTSVYELYVQSGNLYPIVGAGIAVKGRLVGAGTNVSLIGNGAISNTSGQFNGVKIFNTYNQTSGTAANTDLLINRTETAVGSGTQLLIDAQVGGASKFNVTNTGAGYLAAASWTYGSDRRLKENITYLQDNVAPDSLTKIMQLKPAKFDYITGAKDNLGFIAQDVQAVIPEAVSITDPATGMLGLKTDFIVPYLVGAVQEQQTQITAVANQISTLKLKTDTNITTLLQLQTSVDENLLTINNKFATIDTQLASSASELADSKTITTKLQTQIDELKLQNQKYEAFDSLIANISNIDNLIFKDSLGNLDLLGGKLTASEIEAGVLTIKVVDLASPTIGTGVIKAGESSVIVSTKAVGATSKIFTSFEKNPGSSNWVEKVTDPATGQYVGFKILVANQTAEDVLVDWWIVQEGK